LLLRSLLLIAEATSGEPEGLKELNKRAETHNRHNLDIQPELYEFWLSTLIATSKEFGDYWSQDIENSWCKILGYAINHLSRSY